MTITAKEAVLSNLETLNGTTIHSLMLSTGYSDRSVRRALTCLEEEGQATEVRLASESTWVRRTEG